MLPSSNTTTPERTNWRDQELSNRHRLWGPALKLVDIDTIWVEYDFVQERSVKAVALVEYKNERGAHQRIDSSNNRALRDLADRARLPFFVVTYSSDLTHYCVVPYSRYARKWLQDRAEMDEAGYVEFLYRLRGRDMPAEIANILRAQTRLRAHETT